MNATIKPYTLIPVTAVLSHRRRRKFDPAYVTALSESIRDIGLWHPITVAPMVDGVYPLVAGEHRLEACKCLGWVEIPAMIASVSEIEREIWQIDENLQRAELTELERDEHLARRKMLYLQKHPETAHGGAVRVRERDEHGCLGTKVAKFATLESAPSFVEDTAAKTGLSERTIRQAIHRAEAIAPEVREEIQDVPEIADSGVELDALARLPEPEQARAVEAVKSGKARTIREALPPSIRKACPSKSEVWRTSILSLWERGTAEDRAWFLGKTKEAG